MISFFLPMIPPNTTAQEHKVAVRGGKPVFYDPPEVKKTKEKLIGGLALHVPSEPFKGAVELKVQWLYPHKEKHNIGQWKTTKPDTDNLNKALKDCMTQLGFWKDDSQVSVEHIEKRYNDISGIYIEVREL